MKWFLILTLVFTTCAFSAEVQPNGIFFDLFGKICSSGEPAPIGGIVCAYSESGILCGQSRIKIPGYFGILHVYADDPQTKALDGVKKGEKLILKLNDRILQSDKVAVYQTPFESLSLILTDGEADTKAPELRKTSVTGKTIVLEFSEPVNHLLMKKKENYSPAEGIEEIKIDLSLSKVEIRYADQLPSQLVISELSDIFGNFTKGVLVAVPVF